MRAWIVDGLRRLADWLEGPVEAPAVDLTAFEERVQALVAEQDARWPERSGEAKRHQVLAVLYKEFPDVGKRVVSRAIEASLVEG